MTINGRPVTSEGILRILREVDAQEPPDDEEDERQEHAKSLREQREERRIEKFDEERGWQR
jgi:hypothetical protein